MASNESDPQKTRSNAEVADAFTQLADYLELQGENQFKVRAYRTAATSIEGLREPLATIARENRLGEIPGFGDAIQSKTLDILSTGTTPLLEKAREAVPATLLEFLKLPGIGPKTIHQLWQSSKLVTIDALEEAASEGKIRGLPGMGEKTEQKILGAIERYRRYSGRMLLSEAREMAQGLVDSLAARPEVQQAAYAGSARRGVETIGDLDLVGASTDPAATMNAFINLPQVSQVIATGDTSTRVILSRGIECDLRLVRPGDFGMLLHHFTGSGEHNAHLRRLAESRGLKINEYGVFRGDEELKLGDDETAVYAALGLDPVPVHLREDRGEIEAAQQYRLPNLIEVGDIRGDLHTHTSVSDGTATILQMASAAKAKGYEYLAITDHSPMVAVANGLSPDRLKEHIVAVREARDKAGIFLFAGAEVDIRQDGTMDYADDLLEELDIVVASVHSRFGQNREQMTARITSALTNPYVNLIGHPTGRLLNARDPYEVDFEEIVRLARETGTALEVNSAPQRLDLNDINVRIARDHGVRIVIDTDAHSTAGLDQIEYGVIVARRGWIEAKDVINTMSLKEVTQWLGSKKRHNWE